MYNLFQSWSGFVASWAAHTKQCRQLDPIPPSLVSESCKMDPQHTRTDVWLFGCESVVVVWLYIQRAFLIQISLHLQLFYHPKCTDDRII